MFTALLLRELHSHLLTYRFALTAVLLSVLVIGSTLVLGLNYDRRLDAYSEAKAAREQRLEGNRSVPWQLGAGGGRVAG